MSHAVDVMNQALQLPEKDRAELAQRLLLSLEPQDFDDATDAEVEAAETAEAEQRAEAFERGETSAEDWRIVMARLRDSLDTRGDQDAKGETP